MKTAIEQTEALLGAMADAGRRADQAMREGLVPYDPRVSFARRNLLELWFVWAWATREQKDMAPRFRRQLRRAILTYRQLSAPQPPERFAALIQMELANG
jgi:hypothetical protein